MFKKSKPFLVITFIMSFALAFYFANKMYPIIGDKIYFVTQFANENNKLLPLKDENNNVLNQIIAFEPNTLELVYTIPNIESYKVNIDSVSQLLESTYANPSKKLLENLNKTDQNIEITYLFKDKNQTKITSFKKEFLMLTK